MRSTAVGHSSPPTPSPCPAEESRGQPGWRSCLEKRRWVGTARPSSPRPEDGTEWRSIRCRPQQPRIDCQTGHQRRCLEDPGGASGSRESDRFRNRGLASNRYRFRRLTSRLGDSRIQFRSSFQILSGWSDVIVYPTDVQGHPTLIPRTYSDLLYQVKTV